MKQNSQLGYVITKTALRLKNRVHHLLKENGFDITPDQFELLGILWEHEGVLQTQLASIMSKDKTNVTRILDLLEKKNLIERRKDENDRRAYNIYLTKEGRKNQNALKQVLIKGNRALTKNLSARNIDDFNKVMKQINQNLEGG